MKFVALIFILSFGASAAIPEKSILEGISKKLDVISSADAWKEFIKKGADVFPETTKKNDRTNVVVKKEELDLDGSFYTLGVGYRQTFIKAPMLKVKRILNSPELFKDLYGLDSTADIDGVGAKGKPEDRNSFRARIFKRVSLIPDQDYILDYSTIEEKGLWIQRVKLNKDNERFALRDNLKVLEPADGGVIFREVSIIYALKWYVRFFGPSVREVMNKELAKITESVKCLAERNGEPTQLEAFKCWEATSN